MRFNHGALQAILREREISQAKLGRDLGINPRVISRWVHGTRWPNTQNLLRLAQYLNVSLDDLTIEDGRYKGDGIYV